MASARRKNEGSIYEILKECLQCIPATPRKKVEDDAFRNIDEIEAEATILKRNEEKQKKIYKNNSSNNYNNDGEFESQNDGSVRRVDKQSLASEKKKIVESGIKIMNYFSLLLAAITFAFCVVELLKIDFTWDIYETKILRHSLIFLMIFSLLFFWFTTMRIMRKKTSRSYEKGLLIGVVVCITLVSIPLGTSSIFINEVKTKMQQNMKNTLINNYGKDPNHSVNKQWAELQQTYKCCGVDDNSTTIYQVTAWFEPYSHLECYKAKHVPPSCCTNPFDTKELEKCQVHCTGPPRYNHGDENPFLFTQGCYPKVKERLLSVTYTVRILSSLSVVFLICSFCILIYRLVSNKGENILFNP